MSRFIKSIAGKLLVEPNKSVRFRICSRALSAWSDLTDQQVYRLEARKTAPYLHLRPAHGEQARYYIQIRWIEQRSKQSPFSTLILCHRGVLDFFSVFPWPAFCISTWTAGSMLLALGLTVPQAIGAAVSFRSCQQPIEV